MKTTPLLRFLIIGIVMMIALPGKSQTAPERSAPFTAVKWLQDNPYVMVNDEWYLLVTLEKMEAAKIVAFCKKTYGKKWQERFSEDIVEVFTAMGKPLPVVVEMMLIKDGKTTTKKETMTAEKRKKARTYNDQQAAAEKPTTAEGTVKQVQKDVSTLNLKMDKPFECKSGKIEFTVTGHKFYAGSEVLYFDDYGKTVIVVTDKSGVKNMPEKTTVIWRNNQCTTINHVKKTYFTSPVRQKSTEPPVISYSTDEQRKQGGYQEKSSEKICGKDCRVFAHTKNNVTYWLWKGVDVKFINYALGGDLGYTKEAKTIEENIVIPASLFEIPEGYTKQ